MKANNRQEIECSIDQMSKVMGFLVRNAWAVKTVDGYTVSQGYAGRCWIVAGLNFLREYIVKQLGKNVLQCENFKLSLSCE